MRSLTNFNAPRRHNHFCTPVAVSGRGLERATPQTPLCPHWASPCCCSSCASRHSSLHRVQPRAAPLSAKREPVEPAYRDGPEKVSPRLQDCPRRRAESHAVEQSQRQARVLQCRSLDGRREDHAWRPAHQFTHFMLRRSLRARGERAHGRSGLAISANLGESRRSSRQISADLGRSRQISADLGADLAPRKGPSCGLSRLRPERELNLSSRGVLAIQRAHWLTDGELGPESVRLALEVGGQRPRRLLHRDRGVCEGTCAARI